MKHKYILQCLLSLLVIFGKTYAQSIAPFTTNVAGGSYDNVSSYSRFEWNFGELTLTDTYTNAAANSVLTQGLLQPCTDKVEVDFTSSVWGNNEWKIFPNVTKGPFELNFFLNSPGVMQLQLTNALGQILEIRKFTYHCCSRIERYDLSKYANGVYFIHAQFALNGQDRLSEALRINRQGTFKIVKIK